MDCYACGQEATQRCPRCGNPYCPDHGEEFCAQCLSPASAAPSAALFRASLLALLIGSVVALWLLVRPPGLPTTTPAVTLPPPTPEPSPPAASPTPAAGPEATPLAAETTPQATPEPTPESTPTPTPEPTPARPLEYTVVDGDTWYGIAEAFGVDPEELAAANDRTLEDFIFPGEVLIIPQ